MSKTITSRKVPYFNYSDVFCSQQQEFLEIVSNVCQRGAYIMQRDLKELEQQLAEYVGAKYVIGMANATDALHFAVRAAGIGPGDEVIFCSHTMVATPAAAHFAGATSVPVECGPDHLIDPASVEAAITPRTKAIMPTQLNGRTCDMDALQSIADKHDLLIIEDSAQALGSKFKGRCAGTFGIAGCISFYPAKTLGCLGDGGCLITNDDDLYEYVMLMRDHGRNHDGEVVMWGLNSRLDNLQAAILNHKLKTYGQDIARRREIAAMYHEALEGIESLVLPPAPDSDPDHFDIYQNYEVEADHRDDLSGYLSQKNIGTLLPWGGKAVHQYKKLDFPQQLPFTEQLFEKMVMLPINTSLSDDDVRYVAQSIVEFYEKAEARRSEAA